MPKAAQIEDDGDELLTLPGQEEGGEPEDNGNTPDPEPAKPAKVEPEAVAETDPEPEDEGGKGKFIPKGRFDEVNERMKEMARQNAELIAALAANAGKTPAAAPAPAAEAEFDMKATIKARNQALASGDDDLAADLDEKIQTHTLSEARRLAREDMRAENGERTAKEQEAEMKRVAAELTKAYPQLDPNSPDVDADAIDFVVARRNKLIAEGRPMHEALRMAVDVAAKRFFTDPEADPSPTKTDPATARVIAARTAAAAAAALQPPALGGKGDRSTVTARQDVSKMTDEEFEALPLAEKKRLRGDA